MSQDVMGSAPSQTGRPAASMTPRPGSTVSTRAMVIVGHLTDHWPMRAQHEQTPFITGAKP